MGSGASLAQDGVVKRAVFICHSSQEPELRRRVAASRESEPPSAIAVLTESYPRDKQARADLLALVQVAVLAIDAAFQQSPTLVETVSFLKDNRKGVVAGPLTLHSRPSGAIGAICFAFGVWEPDLFLAHQDWDAKSTALSFLSQDDANQVLATSSLVDSELDEIAASEHALLDAAKSESDSSNRRLLYVFAGDDGDRVATTFAGLAYDSTTVVQHCTQELEQDLATLARARVVAFVITDACMGTGSATATYFRRLFEAAIRWHKPVLPINTATKRMDGWLAMAMAGKLWYQVALDDLEQIHTKYADIPGCACKVDDSCLAADFMQCLGGLLTSSTASSDQVDEREAVIIAACGEKARVVGGLSADQVDSLCSNVRDLTTPYSNDTPDHSSRRQQLEALGVAMDAHALAQQVVEEEREVRSRTPSPLDLLPPEPENEQLKLTTIHYKVTRMGLQPLPSVLDARGVPLPNLQLDAMFSYQWGSQQTVLDVHQQGQVHNVRAWFDVYGHMQGNVNAAMATAVENVACVVVFLTRDYVRSVNCRLEFMYARKCGKPMVFAFLEDPRTLADELPDWITDAAGSTTFSVLPSLPREAQESRVLALDFTRDQQLRGVAMTTVLFGAIRQLAAARHRGAPRIAFDGSLLLYATTSALRHAALQPSESTKSSVVVCTRCGAAFDPAVASSVDGCRKHAAYYMGGSLLAGRWVCCQEQQKNGAGCQLAQHTAAPRTWTIDPAYGTYSWQPE